MVQILHYSYNSGCCRRFVASWITILSWHTVFTKRVIYKFTLVWYSVKQGTSHLAQLYTALSFSVRTQMAVQLGWWSRWPVFVLATLESQNIFSACTWSSNQSGGGVILALYSFLNQIPHQKGPEILVGIFSPIWR